MITINFNFNPDADAKPAVVFAAIDPFPGELEKFHEFLTDGDLLGEFDNKFTSAFVEMPKVKKKQ